MMGKRGDWERKPKWDELKEIKGSGEVLEAGWESLGISKTEWNNGGKERGGPNGLRAGGGGRTNTV